MTQPPGTFPFITTLAVSLFGAAINNPLVVRDILHMTGITVVTEHAAAGMDALSSNSVEDFAALLHQTCRGCEDLDGQEILATVANETMQALNERPEMEQVIGVVFLHRMEDEFTLREARWREAGT